MKLQTIFVKRQKKLQDQLRVWKVDCFLCHHPVDIFYLTGMQLSLGMLLIQPKIATLFVDHRYYEAAKKQAHCSVKKGEAKQLLTFLSSDKCQDLRIIGFDTTACYGQIENFKKTLKTISQKRCLKKPYRMKGFMQPIQSLRAIKDPSELLLIKKSAELLWKGFLHAKRQLKVGVEERQIGLDFEIYCRKLGAEELSFPPIIAFGSNSALPHYHTGKRRLKKNDVVLMDLGVRLNGYASDMTRTFFFGKGPIELQKLYQVVLDAKNAALAFCSPDIPLAELDKAARQVMKKAGVEKHFIHSLGHGIGLDVHESPSFRGDKDMLKPHMVITIEPGLYFPGKGGIRLEDMVIITKTGHENLFQT